MSEEKLRNVLRSFGATEKEAETYIFLAKHGILKGGEIAKRTKTHKGLTYRILGNLQRKGLVEATLEAPARFAAVPFEAVLDLNIKIRQEETARIEAQKIDLLDYWKNISKTAPEQALERFAVIEGSHKIYPKICQMTKETKNHLSAVSTVSLLLRAERFGLFETILAHPPRREIQFRFLTDLSLQNLRVVKNFLKNAPKAKFNLKARNPQLGLQLAPRMVIRDTEEIIFFITPGQDTYSVGQDEVCLWTNSKELVHAFTAVFDDLWQNSTDIGEKILELETGKPAPKTCVIKDATTARRTYEQTLRLAREEILTLTSAKGLMEQSEKAALIREWTNRGVAVKIMAPITSENLCSAATIKILCRATCFSQPPRNHNH